MDQRTDSPVAAALSSLEAEAASSRSSRLELTGVNVDEAHRALFATRLETLRELHPELAARVELHPALRRKVPAATGAAGWIFGD